MSHALIADNANINNFVTKPLERRLERWPICVVNTTPSVLCYVDRVLNIDKLVSCAENRHNWFTNDRHLKAAPMR